MNKPTFYALILINSDGQEQFGGAFIDDRLAHERGEASGKRFEVRPAFVA
jgi:hypothetical protein